MSLYPRARIDRFWRVLAAAAPLRPRVETHSSRETTRGSKRGGPAAATREPALIDSGGPAAGKAVDKLLPGRDQRP
jgi:hypothetical protein